MTCASALESMLDADPAELTLQAETPLAAHLRGCARCARAANLIVRETAQISRGMPLPSPSGAGFAASVGRTRRVRSTAIVAIAATVIVAVGVSWNRGGPVVPDRAPGRLAASAAPVAVAPVAPIVQELAPPPATRLAFGAGQPSVAGLVRVEAVAEKAATAPVLPGPARGAQNVAHTGGISVAPPAGTRATIFTTRDPNITVVWLQADDTNRSPR